MTATITKPPRSSSLAPTRTPNPSTTSVALEHLAGDKSADLVSRLVAREEAAYEVLVRDHGARMLAVARSYLKRHHDAEDALQDSLLRIIQSIPAFTRASSLETWTHRIVVNSALMILRRERRKPHATLDESILVTSGALPGRRSPAVQAHDDLATMETRALLHASIHRLPEVQRSILTLHELDALEPREIGVLLGVDRACLKSQLHRARQLLRKDVDRRMRRGSMLRPPRAAARPRP